MKIKPLLLLCVVVCLASFSLLHSQNSGDAALDARALLQSAHQSSGLSAVLPYEMRGVVVFNPGPGEVKGQIAILRDQGRSRVDLQFASYHESRVVLGNKMYITRSTAFPAPGVSRLVEIDRTWDRLPQDGDAALGNVSRKKIQNAAADCFEVKGEQHHRLCFESSRKVLLEDMDQQKAIQLSDYQAVSGAAQFYPRKIIVLAELEKSEKPIFIVQDIDVHKAQITDSAFALPEHPLELATCENMQSPKLIESQRPQFPRSVSRRNSDAGGVYAYGIVATDGKLQNIKVLTSDSDVQGAVVDALKQWRYAPASCGSSPVAAEQEIQIPFQGAEGRR
jgi:hypothetical protein